MHSRHTIALASGSLSLSAHLAEGWALEDLCDFASRQNPKRAFLFVSKVLGKHVPAKPSAMLRTHAALADQLRPFLKTAGPVLFLGFAETATGFGAGVFDACLQAVPTLDALYVQTTRYHFDRDLLLHFQEEHSHATGHLLYAPDQRPEVFYASQSLVLLDDELTTGKTNINFLREFLQVNPRITRVALVSLLNWMSAERRQATLDAFPGIEFTFCALMQGAFEYSANPGFVCPAMPAQDGNRELKDDRVPHSFGRFGYGGSMAWNFAGVVEKLALRRNRPVHVVGDAEFMYPPFLLARHLEQQGYDSYVQSTTRSPILVGGAVATKLQFADHYADGITNYLYNAPADSAQVVFCHEAHGALELPQRLGAKTVSYQELLCP